MARDIDRKLRVTGALLGAATVKDLAAAFRRANPTTSFDVDRAHKWLQGRARPRELGVYDDWAKLVDLGRPGARIADCALEEFIAAVCARHARDRAAIERHLEGSRRPAAGADREPGVSLTGTYVCYSHAWSPHFRGRLVRGELSITQSSRSRRLSVRYRERAPTGWFQLDGGLEAAGRVMYLDLREPRGDGRMFFCLFLPARPASVIAGLTCGPPLVDPEAQPTVTRIVMIRLPAPSMRLRSAEVLVPARASLAEDLASLGLRVPDPAAVDRALADFLAGDQSGGFDQIVAPSHRALLDLFDPIWFEGAEATGGKGDARVSETPNDEGSFGVSG